MSRKPDDVTIKQLLAEHIDSRPRGARSSLARATDVSAGVITRWADGELVPEEHRAEAIAEALDVPLDTVLTAITNSRLERQLGRPAPLSVSDRVDRLEEQMTEVLAILRKRGGSR